jgi:hypothetical protein
MCGKDSVACRRQVIHILATKIMGSCLVCVEGPGSGSS